MVSMMALRKEERLELEVQKLNEYLATLPSQEEWQSLKSQLRAKSQECELLRKKLKDSLELVDKNSDAVIVAEERSRKLELANEDLSKELSYEKIKHEQKKDLLDKPVNAGAKEVDRLTESNEKLREERNKLKKYVILSKEKHKSELSSLESELKDAKSRVSQLSEENEILRNSEEEERKSNFMLRNQVKNAFGRVSDLQEEIQALQESLKTAKLAQDNLRQGVETISEVKRLYLELAALSRAILQISSNEDPSLSGLLGISSPASPCSPPLQLNETKDFSSELQDLVKAQQEQLDDLRKIVSEKYALELADKSEGCLTQ